MSQTITNGCGGKGAWIKVPNFIFYASCVKHDILYNIGKKPIDRFVADFLFYWYMLKDCNRIASKYWLIYPISWAYYFFWATIYMISVRIFGKKYFNYEKAQ